MTTGFRNSAGTDLDAVFDPYVQGTSPGATGYRLSTGVDINTRYAPLTFGTAAAVTGYRISSGADLNTLFAAFGTAHYSIPSIQGGTYSVKTVASAVSGQTGASAGLSLAFNNDGTYSFTVTAQTSGGSAATITGLPSSGTWLPSGWAVADTDIQISYVATTTEANPATITNPAPTYTSLSANQSFLMSATCAAANTNSHGSSLAMTVLLKQVSTGAVITTTFTAVCDAASGV